MLSWVSGGALVDFLVLRLGGMQLETLLRPGQAGD